MSKKSRKARIKSRVNGPSLVEGKKPSQPAGSASSFSKVMERQPALAATGIVQSMNHDYVKSDLIQIGIITGILILIIILLNFMPILNS